MAPTANYSFDEGVIQDRDARHPIHPIFISRRSLRKMDATPVSDEDLQAIFEAARWSPSHYNTQNWRFVYAKRDTPNWDAFADALVEANRAWAKDAGVLIVALSKKSYVYSGKLIPLPSHSFEAGAAFMSMALEGTARGLVVHAMGGYDEAKAKSAIGLNDEDYAIEVMIAVGNSAKAGPEMTTKRFEVEKFISEGKFVEKL